MENGAQKNFQQPLSKLERNRFKREQKKEGRARARKYASIKKLLRWALGAAVAAAIIGGLILFKRVSAPITEDTSMQYPDQGRNHIAVGSEPFEYNSNPPTSGPHYADWIKQSVLEQETDDRYLIHNLEHGHIWISYRPERVSETTIAELRKLASAWTVITPRSKNETDITIAAWTRLDKFNLENGTITPELLQRIKSFIERHKSKSPEHIPIGTLMR